MKSVRKMPLLKGKEIHTGFPLGRAEQIGDPQYLEVKQMADILRRYRTRVRLMAANYRCWSAEYQNEKDKVEKTYMAYEGIFLRQQLGDAWKLYVMANKDYHAMRRGYLANLRQPPHYGRGVA